MALSIAMPGSGYEYTPAAAPIVERSTIGGAPLASIPKNEFQLEWEKYLPSTPASIVGTPTEALWKKTARTLADARFQAKAIRVNSMSWLPQTIQNELREQIRTLGKDVVLATLDATATAAQANLTALSTPEIRDAINKSDPTYTPPGFPPVTPAETPEAKAFRFGRERFLSDVTPRIQEGLNAQGLLESGATPEALAKALKDSAAATSNEQLTKLMNDIQARYAPMTALTQQMRGTTLQQSSQLNATQLAQLLQNMSLEAQQPAPPDILAQLLGTGAGAGLTALLTRRRNSPDLSALLPARVTAGTTSLYGPSRLPY